MGKFDSKKIIIIKTLFPNRILSPDIPRIKKLSGVTFRYSVIRVQTTSILAWNLDEARDRIQLRRIKKKRKKNKHPPKKFHLKNLRKKKD